MLDVLIHILAILDDMTEEIDRMSKNPNGRTTNISKAIKRVRKEVNNLQCNEPAEDAG